MAMSAFTHEGWELVTQNDSGVRTIHTWPNTDLRPMELTHFQDNIGQSWVYFSGETEFSDRELFKLKSGFNEVTRVKDINPIGSSDPMDLTVVGNTIYFTAWTAASGRELWKTDGTSAGTVLVEDIKSGLGSGSNPKELSNLATCCSFPPTMGLRERTLDFGRHRQFNFHGTQHPSRCRQFPSWRTDGGWRQSFFLGVRSRIGSRSLEIGRD